MKRFAVVLVFFAVVISLLLVTPFPNSQPGLTEAEIAQIEAEVREEIIALTATMNDGFMRGDAEAVLSVYSSDVRIYYPGLNVTRDGFRDYFVESFQTVTWTEVEYDLMELFVHGDVAYAIGEWSGMRRAEGQDPVSVIWNCFSRMEKENGVWKDDTEVCGPREAPEEG